MSLTSSKWNSSQQDHHEKPPHRRVDDCAMVEEMYQFGKRIGEGSFGQVIEATNIKTGVQWAIKRVNKEKAGKSSIMLLENEVSILRRVHHKYIVNLNEVIETPKKMYLVLELCLKGELKDVLDEKGPFTEPTARHIIKCLTEAIVYLHRNGIVHRDLKLENILVAEVRGDEQNPLYDIKLSDFGLSVMTGTGLESMLQSTCGTPVYMAPEVVQNHDYTQQCDIWSVGVILYALLSKEFPFMSDTEDSLYEIIKKGEVRFTKPNWKDVSSAAKDLIEQLLTVDPAYRPTASEVISHPWMLGHDQITSQMRHHNVLDLMKDFNSHHYDETDEDAEDDNIDFDNNFILDRTENKISETPRRPNKLPAAAAAMRNNVGTTLPPPPPSNQHHNLSSHHDKSSRLPRSKSPSAHSSSKHHPNPHNHQRSSSRRNAAANNHSVAPTTLSPHKNPNGAGSSNSTGRKSSTGERLAATQNQPQQKNNHRTVKR